jgi:REP element-mobilizing transposase RayT
MSRYFVPDSWYFITVPTSGHRAIFEPADLRNILRDRLEQAFVKFHVEYPDYAIMADHYHLLSSFGNTVDIPDFMQWVNGGVSHLARKRVDIPLPIWDEYHVFAPMQEDLLDKVRGYVVGNPLKHGDVHDEKELRQWPYSTYGKLVVREGEEYAKDVVASVMHLEEGEFLSSFSKPL